MALRAPSGIRLSFLAAFLHPWERESARGKPYDVCWPILALMRSLLGYKYFSKCVFFIFVLFF